MLLNNYDTNSQGNDIEVKCYYDCWQAQNDFEGTIDCIDNDKRIYFDNEYGSYDISDYEEITIKALKKDLLKFIEINEINYYEWLNTATKQELIEYIIDIYDINLCNCEWHDNNTFIGYGFDISCMPKNKDLQSIYISGYSQGDYATVYYIETKWHRNNERVYREAMHHTFYDVPITCLVTINQDKEIYYDEIASNIYEWNKEEFIQYILKQVKDVTYEELDNILPSEITNYLN